MIFRIEIFIFLEKSVNMTQTRVEPLQRRLSATGAYQKKTCNIIYTLMNTYETGDFYTKDSYKETMYILVAAILNTYLCYISKGWERRCS